MNLLHRAVFAVCAALALPTLAVPTHAQFDGRGGPFAGRFSPSAPPPDAPNAKPSRGIVYLGGGQTAVLGALRQVTTNAHVTQFEFAPTKAIAAVTGTRMVGGKTVPALWLCDVHAGTQRPVPIPCAASKAGTPPAPFVLHGWDSTGRFLLVSQDAPAPIVPPAPPAEDDTASVPDTPPTLFDNHFPWRRGAHPSPVRKTVVAKPSEPNSVLKTCLFRVDTGVAPIKASWIQTPGLVLKLTRFGNAGLWSPSHTRLLLYGQPVDTGGEPQPDGYLLYNITQDKTRVFTVPNVQFGAQWEDDNTLQVGSIGRSRRENALIDVRTGQQTPAPVRRHSAALPSPARCPLYPRLWVYAPLEKPFVPLGTVFVSLRVLWLNVDGPQSPVQSAFADVVSDGAEPQAAWASDATGFGFLAQGELCWRGVSFQPATLEERDTGGDTLTDTEQETLARATLARIWAALMAHYRPGYDIITAQDEFDISIAPTLAPDVPLTIAGRPFAFHDSRLPFQYAVMYTPETLIGGFDLSRVTVTLYGDGRIVSVPHPAAGGFPGAHPHGSTAF